MRLMLRAADDRDLTEEVEADVARLKGVISGYSVSKRLANGNAVNRAPGVAVQRAELLPLAGLALCQVRGNVQLLRAARSLREIVKRLREYIG